MIVATRKERNYQDGGNCESSGEVVSDKLVLGPIITWRLYAFCHLEDPCLCLTKCIGRYLLLNLGDKMKLLGALLQWAVSSLILKYITPSFESKLVVRTHGLWPKSKKDDVKP
jgi:hypothetical protein